MAGNLIEETIIDEILGNENPELLGRIEGNRFFLNPKNKFIVGCISKVFQDGEDLTYENTVAEINSRSTTPEKFRKECLDQLLKIQEKIHAFAEVQVDTLIERNVHQKIKDTAKKMNTVGNAYTPTDAARDMLEALQVIQHSYKDINHLEYEKFKLDYVEKVMKGEMEEQHGLTLNNQALRGVMESIVPGLYIIAGRPSMGKTMFANNLVADLILDDKQGGVYFSIENTKEVTAKSIIGIETRLYTNTLLKNTISDVQAAMIKEKIKEKNNLWIFDESMTVEQIRRETEKLIKQASIKFIVIDYFQIMKRNGKRPEREEFDMMSAQLKRMWKELDITIFLLSQVNDRDEGKKRDQYIKFSLGDLKGTGQLEADADVVIGFEGIRHERKRIAKRAKHRYGTVQSHPIWYEFDRGLLTENTAWD